MLTVQAETPEPIGVQSQTLNECSELLALHRRINTLPYAASLQELVNQALDLLIDFTQAESATYFRFDTETEEMVVKAIRGDEESQHLIGLRLPRQEALLQAAQNANQPLVIGDLYDDPRWLRTASPTTARRMTNLISLPLVTPGGLIGVIQINNFRQAKLNSLEMLRERLAVDFELKAESEAAQRRNQRLLTLIDTIGEEAGTLDRRKLLQIALEKAAVLVDAERSSIFLVNPGTDDMAFQIAYQSPEEQPKAADSKPSARGNLQEPESVAGRLFSRSAITVPITLQPGESEQDDAPRNLGGLMALNPNRGSFNKEDVQLLHILAKQTSSFLQVAEVFESTEDLFLDAIKALVTAIDAKDPYTQGHSHRMSEYAVLIAQELGLGAAQINDIRIGSLLHDVGKIGIPDAILKKAGMLTADEWVVIKSHPQVGWNILHEVTLLEPVLPGILEHHEKLDGSGYPHGLRGEQISLMGRIVTVADVFDAMTSDRPYRPALSVVEVLAYLRQEANQLFDKNCVQALHTIINRNNPQRLS